MVLNESFLSYLSSIVQAQYQYLDNPLLYPYRRGFMQLSSCILFQYMMYSLYILEERRVGEEGRSRWSADSLKKKKEEYRCIIHHITYNNKTETTYS